MTRPTVCIVLLLVQTAAFWPVWIWYAARMSDGSDEPWGLASLVLAVLLFVRLPKAPRPAPSFLAGSLATLVYAAAFPVAPPILRAGLALAAIAVTVAPLREGRGRGALFGLLLLSLPVVASLQFYLGHPLRVVSAFVATGLLSFSGFNVIADGTCLRFGTQLVAIDAPCSGVRMLWGGTFLALALAAVLQLQLSRTACLTLGAAAIVVLANALRAAALFFPEAGVIVLPAWSHAAIGLVTFAAAGALVVRWAMVLVPTERLR